MALSAESDEQMMDLADDAAELMQEDPGSNGTVVDVCRSEKD